MAAAPRSGRLALIFCLIAGVLGVAGIAITGVLRHGTKDEPSSAPPVDLKGVVESLWGPDRTFYTMDQRPDRAALNAITDSPSAAYGDERYFFWIETLGHKPHQWSRTLTLRPGQRYRGWIYFQNAAAPRAGDAIATNARIRVELPGTVEGRTNANAFLSARGVLGPPEVFSSVVFSSPTSSGSISPRIVPRSVVLSGYGRASGSHLSVSDLTGDGVLVGCDQVNGRLDGSKKCSGAVRFDFIADQADFSVQAYVRHKDSDTWQQRINAKPGELVSLMVRYENTGTTLQKDVVLKADLPSNLLLTDGSSYLKNGSHPSGIKVSDNITSRGVNVGNYLPGGVVYLMFNGRIAEANLLPCGEASLRIPMAAVTNNGAKSTPASISTTKDCN